MMVCRFIETFPHADASPGRRRPKTAPERSFGAALGEKCPKKRLSRTLQGSAVAGMGLAGVTVSIYRYIIETFQHATSTRPRAARHAARDRLNGPCSPNERARTCGAAWCLACCLAHNSHSRAWGK
jgi:hypothetical protein